MKYSKLCEVYQALESTTKGLEKTKILSEFLKEIKEEPELIYLLQGKVFPDYDTRELGLSEQISIKIISRATGISEEQVVKEFKHTGELGITAQNLIEKKKQSVLFSKPLTTEKVFENLRQIPNLEGKGSIDKKSSLIIELLNSANASEAKFVIRTVLGDLKIGIGSGLIRDAIVEYIYSPKDLEEKKVKAEIIQNAYDLTTDFAEVFEKAQKNKLNQIELSTGKPVKVMLFPKAENIHNAFEIVGSPAAFEFKYDGFRMMINKDEKNNIKIFTRRLEEVTKQFPDVIKYVQENVNAKSFIIDCEAVGYDPKTKKYKQFQDISQRIKRKYEIEKLENELPIEINVFDIIYYNGKSLINEQFKERRKIIEKIINVKNYKIRLAEQIITDNEKEAQKFYERALKEKQEGVMAKSLTAPYKPGARVGYAVKLKPDMKEFDLVITGAEFGTGKRAGWLTSYDVSCINKKDNQLLEIGKVSTGLKEKPEEGLSFVELTEKLKKLIIKEQGKHVIVKPQIVVTVGYQNIQHSPSYNSGFALRFPTMKALRPDRHVLDIATLKEIEIESKRAEKWRV